MQLRRPRISLACSFLLAAAASAQTPSLTAYNVRNAANFAAGGVAPGEVITLFPDDAGPLAIVPWGLDGSLADTVSLGDTRVLFDGEPAIIIYSVRGRICVTAPRALAGRSSTELILEYQGQRSPPVTLPVVDAAPAIFTLDSTGKGAAAMLNETGCCNSVRNPAVLGSTVSLFATGEGILDPDTLAQDLSVTVGGRPAQITYTESAPALQLNFVIPADAPVGDAVPLTLTVRGKPSTPGVTMSVRSPRRRVSLSIADQALRRELTALLEQSGYALTHQPEADLLLLDLETTAATVAAAKRANPQVRLLAAVQRLDAPSLRAADLLGAQAVAQLPLDPVSLLSRVRALLEKRPAVY